LGSRTPEHCLRRSGPALGLNSPLNYLCGN